MRQNWSRPKLSCGSNLIRWWRRLARSMFFKWLPTHTPYVNVGAKLIDTKKCLYWTPCAAHGLDLMLEDVGKMKIHTETLEMAKGIAQFIYNDDWVLNLFRTYAKGKKLLRLAITHFVASWLYKGCINVKATFEKDVCMKNSTGALGQKNQME